MKLQKRIKAYDKKVANRTSIAADILNNDPASLEPGVAVARANERASRLAAESRESGEALRAALGRIARLEGNLSRVMELNRHLSEVVAGIGEGVA